MNEEAAGLAGETVEKRPFLVHIDADLIRLGTTYMRGLVDLVNRGFRTLAPAATLSSSEARSRVGMSDTALRAREA